MKRAGQNGLGLKIMAIAIGAAVSVATAVASHEIEKGIDGSPSASGGGGLGGGAAGGNGMGVGNRQSNYNDTQNAIYGVHVSTSPLSGQQAPKPEVITASKAPAAEKGESPRATPTQAIGTQEAAKDYQDLWADRLSKYLDYNTRALG